MAEGVVLGEVSEGGGGRGLARGAAYPFGLSPSAGCLGSSFTFHVHSLPNQSSP